jgi:hypothetical protein
MREMIETKLRNDPNNPVLRAGLEYVLVVLQEGTEGNALDNGTIHICSEKPCPVQDKECAERLKNGFDSQEGTEEKKVNCPICQYQPENGHSLGCSKYKRPE